VDQGEGPVILSPEGEKPLDLPQGDALLKETQAFVSYPGSGAEPLEIDTAGESQKTLELARDGADQLRRSRL
jgi:hypothetical protein